MNRYSGKERRQFTRIKVSFIVMYRVNQPVEITMMLGDQDAHAIMADLSEDGMAMVTNYDIPPQAQVNAKFIVLNENALRDMDRVKTVEVSGEVRYCSKVKERAYQLGVHFTDITEYDRTFIREFIRWAPKA